MTRNEAITLLNIALHAASLELIRQQSWKWLKRTPKSLSLSLLSQSKYTGSIVGGSPQDNAKYIVKSHGWVDSNKS